VKCETERRENLPQAEKYRDGAEQQMTVIVQVLPLIETLLAFYISTIHV
jgi:hypothetical protein